MQQAEATRAEPVFVEVSELFFKPPNDTKLTHLNAFTLISFTPFVIDCHRKYKVYRKKRRKKV